MEKLFNELRPYMAMEQSNLWYFLIAALLVIAIHVVFTRYLFAKYLPGLLLVVYGLLKLLNNGHSSIFQTEPKDIRASILSLSIGLTSIIFARILAIMYKKKSVRRVSTSKRSNANLNNKIKDDSRDIDKIKEQEV